jgi:serine/threonine-protein kinase Chk1
MPLIQESLEALNVRCKVAPPREGQGQDGPIRLRIGGYDRRRMIFKGWVDVEKFTYRGAHGSFCVMQRDVVCVLDVSPFNWT